MNFNPEIEANCAFVLIHLRADYGFGAVDRQLDGPRR